MNKGDIDNFVSRIISCNKTIEDQNMQADNIKKDLEKLEVETEEFKKKQSDVKDVISHHKLEMTSLEK